MMRKRICSLLLCLLLIMQMLPFSAMAAETPTFQDVPNSHWAYSYVERAFREGMVQGTFYDEASGVRRYEPGRTLSLGQLIVIVTNLMYPGEADKTTWNSIPATDLRGGEWYAKHYLVAYRHGLLDNIMSIYSGGKKYPQNFDMNYRVCRYQMAILLTNAMAAAGLPTKATATTAQIADWSAVTKMPGGGIFTTSVATVYHYGVMQGVDAAGRFSGWGDVTRGQAAAICCRLSDAIQGAGSSTDVNKTGSTNGIGTGSYYPSNGPWEGKDGLTSAYIVETVEELEKAVLEALSGYTKTLMIYTHSDSVIDRIGSYSLTTPTDLRDTAYQLGDYWKIYSSIRKNGLDYAEYRFDITYDYFAYLYLLRTGTITAEEIPPFTYSETVDGVEKTGLYDPEPTLNAVREIERTYGISMNSSNYDKVLAIYSYLTGNFAYDYTYYDILEGLRFDISLTDYLKHYSHPLNINLLLQSGKGVCENFAETFRALCVCFGVKCYEAIGAAGGGAHGWNIVEVDGNWYQCDATWDAGQSPENFKYFLLSDAAMGANHNLNRRDYSYPTCPNSYA